MVRRSPKRIQDAKNAEQSKPEEGRADRDWRSVQLLLLMLVMFGAVLAAERGKGS